MKAETLKGFFEGGVRAAAVEQEAETTNHDLRHHADDVLTQDLAAEFTVRPDHLVALCTAVERSEIQACQLEVIASVLVRSERFTWDPRTPEGALVSRVVYAWEAPEINYVLTAETVKKFARLLTTGQDTFGASDWSEIPGRKR